MKQEWRKNLQHQLQAIKFNRRIIKSKKYKVNFRSIKLNEIKLNLDKMNRRIIINLIQIKLNFIKFKTKQTKGTMINSK